MCLCAKLLQSCLTLCDPMDCSLPGYSVHGDSPSKNTGVGCHFLLQGIFPTQGSNPFPLCLPALAGGFFTTGTTWEAHMYVYKDCKIHIHIAFYIHMYLYTYKNKCIYIYIYKIWNLDLDFLLRKCSLSHDFSVVLSKWCLKLYCPRQCFRNSKVKYCYYIYLRYMDKRMKTTAATLKQLI